MTTVIKPIILCGGTGTRLWPLSRESFPKQFVPLIGEFSLMELTIERIKKFGPCICVASENHRFLVNDLLSRHYETSKSNLNRIILEPAGRNTAAAMGVAALMGDVKSSELLLFLPSDHYVPDCDQFISTIQSGVDAANAGFIVTFGVVPSFPSTAYGYIKQGVKMDQLSTDYLPTYAVDCFIEKPSFETVSDIFLSKSYLWNAGIFLCKASVLIDALSIHAPDVYQACFDSMKDAKTESNFVRPSKSFLNCRSISIDYAVMENYKKIATIPFKGAWSDVGSWNAVATLTSADDSGNRVSGQGLAVSAQNTYINAPYRQVVALGTSNLVIIDTPDAILVSSIDKVEQVKDIVLRLKNDGISEALTHRRVMRPWGWYDSIDKGDFFQVKRICVKSGASLSLQKHYHRAEHWIVVKGVAKVTNGDEIFLLGKNQSTYIPIGVKHRLENPGDVDLEMIEVQSGSYLGEDDIVRFDDAYGR